MEYLWNFQKKQIFFLFSPLFFLFSFPNDRSCIGKVAWPKHQGLVHGLKKGEEKSGSGGVTLWGKQTSITGAFKPFRPERRSCYVQKGHERLTLFHFCLMTNWSLSGEQVKAKHHYHIKVMLFLTGEGETAWLWTKILRCSFLGLLGTCCATHAVGGEEGEKLKPLTVVGHERHEGKRECSYSKVFFNVWHLSILLFHCFKKPWKSAWRHSCWGTWAIHLCSESAPVLELLKRDGKAVWCSQCPLICSGHPEQESQSISHYWWILQDTKKEKPAVVVRGSARDLIAWSTGIVWFPLSSLSGERQGMRVWTPVKHGLLFHEEL